MISLDTNVLVRILVDDEGQNQQVKAARQFAKKQKKLFITQMVQIELVWVLDFSYKLEKSEIISVLQHLLENEAFVLQDEKQYGDALQLYQISSVGFSDCLIQVNSQAENCDIITFDKKFSKLPGVKLLLA